MPGMPHKAHHCNQCQQRAEQQFERNHTLLFGAAGVISLQPELIRLYFNVVLCDCQDGGEVVSVWPYRMAVSAAVSLLSSRSHSAC